MKPVRCLLCLLFFVLGFGSQAQIRYMMQDYNNASALKSATIVPKSNDKVFLKNSKCLLAWDAASTAVEDTLFGVVKQNSITTGRWVKIEPNNSRNYLLNGTYVSLSTTRTAIPEWVFNTISGKKYLIEIVGGFQTTSLTTGISIGFTVPTGSGTIIGEVSLPVSRAAVATGLIGTVSAISSSGILANSFVTSTAVNPSNSPHFMRCQLIYSCVTSGTFQVNFGSEVGGSVCAVLAGSVMSVKPLN
jgi:hypothetical protein